MKPTQIIAPSWWYLIAAIPLGATFLLARKFLVPESYHYTFGGLRNIFVLGSVQTPDMMGLLALIGFGIFIGSAFSSKLHHVVVQKIYSAAALLAYGFWSFQMTMWVLIK